MRILRAVFWKGLATLLPLTVTIYVLYWVVVTLERVLRHLVPAGAYFPGSGLSLGVLLVGVFGLAMHLFLFERLVALGTALLNRIPLVKSLYNALQDFVAYLGQRSGDDLARVVLVHLAGDVKLIGFVTNPRFETPTPDGAATRERISVYLPMSYQIGGFMVLLPPEQVEPLEIPVEDAMRLILTAGVRSG
ncbi:MAG: DUF502 domain-containing protein [Pseudomonadota bacterium]